MSDVETVVRGVLGAHGRLSVPIDNLKDGDDLFQAGLSSHASVNVMLALEDAFGVEIPDSLLKRTTFQTISAIKDALESLGVNAAPS
jgi:acyl carrier protein